MLSKDIAKRFLDYFKSLDHNIAPAAPLISRDKSLMFVVAGMVQFVPYLTGFKTPKFTRVADIQGCVRTLDIDEVGVTDRHLTYFQMLGNWSFGDYFKKEAIRYAYEFLVDKDRGLGLGEKDLWVSVYKGDAETKDIWIKEIGFDKNKIQEFGKEDNYWSMGQAGPAGPCSEIYFDRGENFGGGCGPLENDRRFIEIWNLVFMQDEIDNVLSKTEFDIIKQLPQKNIDTGMGLERAALVLQNAGSVYETDQLWGVIEAAGKISGIKYGNNRKTDIILRLLTDHIRTSVMLLGEGIVPSNEKEGYILRRLIRRAISGLDRLDIDIEKIDELANISYDAMHSGSPKGLLINSYKTKEEVLEALNSEKDIFKSTLKSGKKILDIEIKKGAVSPEAAFKLHDTYGFPIDLTSQIAKEAGIDIDIDKFNSFMEDQKKRSKNDSVLKKLNSVNRQSYINLGLDASVFVGYNSLLAESKVLAILKNGTSVSVAAEGDEVEIFLDKTPFYALGGGQVGDSGRLISNSCLIVIKEAFQPIAGLFSHRAFVKSGQISVGDKITSEVDKHNRFAIAQAHSATHILHAAIRKVFNGTQKGSLNKNGYMRFDFDYSKEICINDIKEINAIALEAVQNNYKVNIETMPLNEAKKLGAMALFGEKYPDIVRVVEINGSFSRELCAGTHVDSSAAIGLINIISSSSVAAGVKRIEAKAGINAHKDALNNFYMLSRIAHSLKSPLDGALDKALENNIALLKESQAQIKQFRSQQINSFLNKSFDNAEKIKEINFICAKTQYKIQDIILKLNKHSLCVAFFINNSSFALFVSKDLLNRFKANDILAHLKQSFNIKGGGGANIANGAISGDIDIKRLSDAIKTFILDKA